MLYVYIYIYIYYNNDNDNDNSQPAARRAACGDPRRWSWAEGRPSPARTRRGVFRAPKLDGGHVTNVTSYIYIYIYIYIHTYQ